MRESVIEAHLVDRVKSLGGLCPKFQSPGRANVPDRMALLPGGRILFIECKAPGERPSDAQLREHDRLRKLGFEVRVVDSIVDVMALT